MEIKQNKNEKIYYINLKIKKKKNPFKQLILQVILKIMKIIFRLNHGSVTTPFC